MRTNARECLADHFPSAKLTVQGKGKIKKVPNQAVIRIQVSTTGGTSPHDARESHAKKCMPVRAGILGFFAKMKSEAKDKILSETLNISPQYDKHQWHKVIGYDASTIFTVLIHEVHNSGDLIDIVTKVNTE